jgi:NAD+ synthase
MVDRFRLALAQLNPTVGAVEANLAQARAARASAAADGADLVLLPELHIAGYPPEDLVLKPSFVAACQGRSRRWPPRPATAARRCSSARHGPRTARSTTRWRCSTAAAIETVRFKHVLPNYGVFDEARVFAAGPVPGPVNFRGVRIGVPICEDIWRDDVPECLVETGAEILLVPNGSPWERDKPDVRLNIAVARVTETGLPLVYLNQVGGQDELVFDGASFALNADRSLALQLPAFETAVVTVDWQRNGGGWRVSGPIAPLGEGADSVWRACVLGLRDYVEKNRFPGVVLGLSGGIDSAVVAAMAVDALGPERVHCVMLPYRYTASDSLEDAQDCARALGCRYDVVPIEGPVAGFAAALEPLFAGLEPDVTEENIQSRCRGTALMAISNKLGSMVLTTGNKSEMSVGYATLYGDMNGGFNPIKDVYKSEVYALARFRNQQRPNGSRGPATRVIPERIISKAPTAELRENQTDQDSLPPYDALDAILVDLIEHELSVAEVAAKGFDRATVERVQQMLYVAEYKRRQAAPGVKITRKNFGRDRRYPITNGFRDRG